MSGSIPALVAFIALVVLTMFLGGQLVAYLAGKYTKRRLRRQLVQENRQLTAEELTEQFPP